ncbi:MAG: hypothetical protein PHY92_00795 [Alphaproteobacteria bacterium]|nr:hypothetical protein [Alphaproteobacteria bacterium]
MWDLAKTEITVGLASLTVGGVSLYHIVSQVFADAAVDTTGALAFVGTAVGVGAAALCVVGAWRKTAERRGRKAHHTGLVPEPK